MGLGGLSLPKYYNTNEFLLLIKQKTEEYRERAYDLLTLLLQM